MKNNREFAVFLSEHIEKENIISEIFNVFDVDCVKRCAFNPCELDSLINEFNQKNECDVSVLEKIIAFIKSEQKDAEDKENQLYRKIKAYIDENFTEDITLETIAVNLYVSYYYMCHIFKEKSGISITVYRTQKRLEKAMRALVQSDDKISDIALSCGFNNVSYFTEAFSKKIGVSPAVFREQNVNLTIQTYYEYDDILFASKTESIKFLGDDIIEISPEVQSVSVCEPDDTFKFLHESAIVEYHGVLYSSWYHCSVKELIGYTPICGKRSFDGGKTWSDLEVVCYDKSEKVIYCPPVYGICDDKLYMLVNQMVSPDHIHSLDLFILNNDSVKFELLWSRPVPFKLNTNVVTLPNGKLMLPGRVAKLDGFPITPAVLISDSGKIDAEWRLVVIAPEGLLPCDVHYIHPEISVIVVDDILYMFCRNDRRKVPIVYISKDYGESWSKAMSHDIPIVDSKIYCGKLSGGCNYLVCNTDKFNRSKLEVFFTEGNSIKFTKRLKLFDFDGGDVKAVHYPAACEYDGKLYVIATKAHENNIRGAILYIIDLKNI